MKKIPLKLTLFALVLLGFLASCGGGGSSTSSTDPTAQTTQNSSHGSYVIAGISTTSIPDDIDRLNEHKNVISLLNGTMQSVDYYMVRYDSSDPLGWVAISPNATKAYKIDGVDKNRELILTPLQGNGVVSFTDIRFNSGPSEVAFGSSFKADTNIGKTVKALANKIFNIEGYLLHYSKDSNANYLFVTKDGSYLGILDGAHNDTKIPLWRELYSDTQSAAVKAAPIRNNNQTYLENLEHLPFRNIKIIQDDYDRSELKVIATYTNILFGTTGKVTVTAKMVPAYASVANGESVTFSTSFNIDFQGKKITGKPIWVNGPTLTCTNNAKETALAVTVIQGNIFLVDGTLECKDNFSIKVFGSSAIFIGESTAFEAKKEVSANNSGVIFKTVKNVIWSSSLPSVATINSNGVATCISRGTTNITATSQKEKSDYAVLECYDNYVFLATFPSDLYVGQEGKLSAIISSKTSKVDMPVIFSSENPSIATVENTGKMDGAVTCIDKGMATLHANIDLVNIPNTIRINEKSTSSKLLCKEPLDVRLSVSGTSPLYVGDSRGFIAGFSNNFGQISNVSTKSAWWSTNPSVASVGIQTGTVTCNAVGAAKIRAQYLYKGEMLKASAGIKCIKHISVSSSSSESSASSSSTSSKSSASSVSSTSSKSSQSSSTGSTGSCQPKGPAYYSGVINNKQKQVEIHFYNLKFYTQTENKIPASGSIWINNSNIGDPTATDFTKDKFWFDANDKAVYIDATTGEFVAHLPHGYSIRGTYIKGNDGNCYMNGTVHYPDGNEYSFKMDHYEQTNMDPGS